MAHQCRRRPRLCFSGSANSASKWALNSAECVFAREFGEMAFDHAKMNPNGYGSVLGKAMSGFSAIQSAWALEALRDYDFSPLPFSKRQAGGSRSVTIRRMRTWVL
jgi:hypothetical protein